MLTIDNLIKEIKEYNDNDEEIVRRAYNYAETLHEGQYRQSGEPYIIHPLNVAYILAQMRADTDTICAGLLHDTLEDTETTKEEIASLFNKEVANLVDGVTKISKMNFSSKKQQNLANTRKIITGIKSDIRIIIIKLADRLHNMRTLEFKSEEKQKENAKETMTIFVPLAYYIGAYQIKSELEDLSLRYLEPDTYKMLDEKRIIIADRSESWLNEMLLKIQAILNDNNIPNETKFRIKNIYGIYKKMKAGYRLSEIHDLFALKVIVDEIEQCYQSLYHIHSVYHPIHSKFKDYICSPKTNLYRSLHTTVFGPESKVQTQIRTQDMEKIASFGFTAYWQIKKGDIRRQMQEDLSNHSQFFRALVEMDNMYGDNEDFIKQVQSELFSEKIYVYTDDGETVELPQGSTPIDLACQIDENIGHTMIGAIINDEHADVSRILQNKDRVSIITDDLSFGPREDWANLAATSHARQLIRNFNKK